MKLTKYAEVFSSDEEKVGTLERVVLDPDTMVVTHLVIKAESGAASENLLPIHYMNHEAGNRIILNQPAKDLEDLPAFDESTYGGLDREIWKGDVDAVYWYPPFKTPWWIVSGPNRYPKPNFIKAGNGIPTGSVALEEGAKVISRDHEEVGDLIRVIVEPKENRATHILVGSGLLTKKHKLVPTLWIKDMVEEKVRLTIKADFFDHLPERDFSL